MIYYTPAPTKSIQAVLQSREDVCLIVQPGNRLGPRYAPGVPWIADNGCFAKQWQAGQWIGMLEKYDQYRADCRFAVCPDVVGDAEATLHRWQLWSPVIRELGYTPAFVLQDGLTVDLLPPWSELSVLFIGGSTDFKLSDLARRVCVLGRKKGCWIHMGRVNSWKRINYAATFCDSVDGTYLTYGPDKLLPKLHGWLDRLN